MTTMGEDVKEISRTTNEVRQAGDGTLPFTAISGFTN